MRSPLRCLLACLLPILSATSALAQDVVRDPSENARFHLGVIRFTPFLALANIGVDTNVYNQLDDPKQDFTMTMGPGADYWLKLGRGRLEARSAVTYTWFQTYGDQRALNTENRAKLSLPLNRLVPFVDGLYDYGRRRVSYEIDARALSTDWGYGGGLDVRATAKSTIRLEGHGERLRFDDEFFLGTSLQESLSRNVTTGAVSLREALTPLTTFVVQTEYEQDRFLYSADKDADGVKVMPGFEFDPLALIGGRVFIGYRRFRTLTAAVPDFTGLIADVAADYRTHATRFAVKFSRDVTYSYEEVNPYYVLTDTGLRVTQKVTRRWDIVGNLGRQWLSYKTDSGVVATGTEDRLDRSYFAGGGLGYQLGEAVRVGVEANYYHRTSNTYEFRGYDGLRVGGSFTYGLSRQ